MAVSPGYARAALAKQKRRRKLLDRLERAHGLVLSALWRQASNPRYTNAWEQGNAQEQRRQKEFDDTLAELRRELGLTEEQEPGPSCPWPNVGRV